VPHSHALLASLWFDLAPLELSSTCIALVFLVVAVWIIVELEKSEEVSGTVVKHSTRCFGVDSTEM